MIIVSLNEIIVSNEMYWIRKYAMMILHNVCCLTEKMIQLATKGLNLGVVIPILPCHIIKNHKVTTS